MNVELIQSYEDRLIAKDSTVCFYEMMTETYNFVGIRHAKESFCPMPFVTKLYAANNYEHIVEKVIALVLQGMTISVAYRSLNRDHSYMLKSLTVDQKCRIQSAKREYNISAGKRIRINQNK